MAIPNEIIEQIQDRVDIVEVISSFVPLKKAGRNFRANCPFHHEKTPSFMVSPDKQIYHCFGCGAGGNVIGFLMRHEKMEFREAVEFLAKKTDVKLPASTREDRERASLQDMLYRINEMACSYYQTQLNNDKRALGYLNDRGMGNETIGNFRLGLAPDMWDGLCNYFKKRNVNGEFLEKTGLAIPSQRGGYYDRFRSRLMFPIFDVRNKILGFGARVLDSSLPKYINSPETCIYSKGKNLYGLNLSKNYIRDKKCAIVVEGYVDFIIPFQAGIKNIIATLGTALTQDQIRLLRRFTHTVVMIFDPDEAGEAATIRNLDLFITEDFNVYVTTLERGCDPDSFIRKFGAEEFAGAIKRAKNLFDYKLDLLKTKFRPADIHGKVNIANEMLPTIARINNAVLKSSLIKRLAEELSIDEASLRLELKKVKPGYSSTFNAPKPPEPESACSAFKNAEKMILALMLEERRFVTMVKELLVTEEIMDEVVRGIVKTMFNLYMEQKPISPSRLMNYLQDEKARAVISEVTAMHGIISDKDRAMADCIGRIKIENINRELTKLQMAIRDAHLSKNGEKLKELVTKYDSLVKRQKVK